LRAGLQGVLQFERGPSVVSLVRVVRRQRSADNGEQPHHQQNVRYQRAGSHGTRRRTDVMAARTRHDPTRR